MKYFIIVLSLFVIGACTTQKTATFNSKIAKNDTIRIANDSLQYEVLIFDPGFNSWFAAYAKPRHFYTQNYMEQRNQAWVRQWNQNVISGPRRDLFEMTIDYDNNTNYGYEVNYLLFNYLTYFQLTNNIQLGVFNARL